MSAKTAMTMSTIPTKTQNDPVAVNFWSRSASASLIPLTEVFIRPSSSFDEICVIPRLAAFGSPHIVWNGADAVAIEDEAEHDQHNGQNQ